MKLHLTPTEQRIYDFLADGEPHKVDDMLSLVDELAERDALYKHIYRLKLKLRALDEEIIAQSFGKYTAYRRIRRLIPTLGT